jgi:hypothetical protein
MKKATFVLALLLTVAFAWEKATAEGRYSKPKVYVRVAFVKGVEAQLNTDYPFETNDQWLIENSYYVVQGPRGGSDWARRYAELERRVIPNMDEPRGYPSELVEYLKWLDRKAKDRDDVKKAMEDAFDAAHGNPEWGKKFDWLLKEAQRSGENTVWDACFKFLRIKKDDTWQNTLFKASDKGHAIYQKAAETKFDPVFVRDQWARCLIRYAINNIEIAKYGLYDGRERVMAQWDKDGYLVIPKRDFDVNCERRIEFQTLQKGDPQTPADKGLAWVDKIREECDWWRLGRERADATQLMVEYFKDVLCFKPEEKSHKWYLEKAKEYRLDEAEEYAKGFYAKLKGTVWIEDVTGRKPAKGAKVMVIDPKDGTTWKATTDAEGKYQIKDALLHTHKGSKGELRCPQFQISAELEGDRATDTYEGPLRKPDRSVEFTKDLVIKRTGLSVEINGIVNWRSEDRDSTATIKSNFLISGTMKMKHQTKKGYSETYEIDQMRVSYSHLAQLIKKKPRKDCPESLEFEVKASGSLPIKQGSLEIRYEGKVPKRHPIKQSMLDFGFGPGPVPGKMKTLVNCNYTTREIDLTIAEVKVIDTQKIANDQTEFSGSRSFGIPDKVGVATLALWMPFIFSDEVLSGGPSSLPKEIEKMISSAGDNVAAFKGFSIGNALGGVPGKDGQLTWKIRKVKHND